MSSRLVEVRDDFERIGLVHPPGSPRYDSLPGSLETQSFSDVTRDDLPASNDPGDWTLTNMHHLLWKSYAILEPNYEPQLSLGDQIVSDAARNLVAYARANHEPFQRSGAEDCSEAEPKLLKHLGIDYRETPLDFPLLIAEDKGHPVGVIKGIGTTLLYGLENRPWYGVLKSGFSVPMSYQERLQKYMQRRHFTETTAWKIPRETGSYVFKVPVSDLGLMSPTRLTQFAVDNEDRQRLKGEEEKDYMLHAYQVSHEDITQRVGELFEIAIPLEERRGVDVYNDFMDDIRGRVFER